MSGPGASGSEEAARVTGLEVAAFRIPTLKVPEEDGTARWDHTTLVTVEVASGGVRGFGYTYAGVSAAHFVHRVLREAVEGEDALSPNRILGLMLTRVRNHGREGVAAMAVSAVDAALWDLKAKLLGVPLATLLGQVRPFVEGYGSGGFTNQTPEELARSLEAWRAQGFGRVKLKVGRDERADLARVETARAALGPEVALMVDANGAWDRRQALRMAHALARLGVTWLEEPVPSDDVEGLRWLRDRVPEGLEIAAGEYGYHPLAFRRLLEAQAVDVLMADATRSLGVSGFQAAAALSDAFFVPLSSHCAPSLHVALGCAAPRFAHLEFFQDHARIEALLLDGAPVPAQGRLSPHLDRPGLGVTLKRQDAERYRV